MKRLVLMIIPTLIWGFVFTSCGSDKTEDDNILHGKWKLIEFNSFYTIEEGYMSFDYSQNNIIYKFEANNVLTISGDVNNIDYRGHEIGKHSYEMLPKPPSGGPAGPCIFGLPIKIDTETHAIFFGWVYFEYYEGSAMHMSTQNGNLILVKVD